MPNMSKPYSGKRKNAAAIACDITENVKRIVWERDKHRCVVCGSPLANPSCHIVPRSKLGMGVETNVVTLCNAFGNNHHFLYDSGPKATREKIDSIIVDHMKSIYGESWNKEDQIYKKRRGNE